jgi:hypothetical protein
VTPALYPTRTQRLAREARCGARLGYFSDFDMRDSEYMLESKATS